jgi:hypothetical protein
MVAAIFKIFMNGINLYQKSLEIIEYKFMFSECVLPDNLTRPRFV